MPAGARHNPGVDARRISGRIDAVFVALIIAGCAPTHQHVGSGYATSTTNPVAAFVASLKHIAWKKEITLGDIATASAALVAVLALILAWVQLRGLSRQSRADVLLKLDERWESKDVVVLREEVDRFIKEIQAKAIQQQTLSGHPVTAEALFPGELDQLRFGRSDRYGQLVRVCGFWETVGYSARAGYIRVRDLHGLLGGAIREHGGVFRKHIERLQTTHPGMLEHFVWLSHEVDLRDEYPSVWHRGAVRTVADSDVLVARNFLRVDGRPGRVERRNVLAMHRHLLNLY